ncbi:MAG: PAS domain S-box protein [Candidatus Methanoperedens sp.]|nr:PAS domain S-box protein [Candidatus Methanoperedens sp.]
MSELKEKHKILIIVIILAIASFLTYYFLAVLRIAIVFTHFFYIPIVLAALWWKRKGMVVAVFLVALLLLSNIFIKNETITYDDAIRAFMFMVIAFLVVLLGEKIEKGNEELKKHQGHLEDIVKERTAELRNTNKQQQIMLDSVPAWLFFKDKENRFIRVNKTFAGIMGMPKEELEGISLFDLYPGEQAEAFWRDDKEVIDSGQPKLGIMETLEIRKETRWVTTDKIPYRDTKGNIIGIIGFAIDITERKIADEKLREVSLYTRSLIEASLDPFVTISKEGKITDVNEAAELVTGVPRDQLIGNDFSDYFTEAEKAREGHQQVFSKGFIRNYPLAIRHTSGEVTEVLCSASVYKNVAGEVKGLFAIARDITERKRSLKVLAESEEKFRTLFDNATDGILLTDVETKNNFIANKAICRMLGYSQEEILNLPVMGIHPEKDIPWIMELFDKQARGEFSLVVNIPVKRKDGTVFYADINTSSVNIAGRSYNLGIFRDVTERRRNEEMRRENERLELANRTKNEFLSVMSHELRTPLNAIIGFSDLLKNKDAGELNKKQQRYADNVYSSGKHLLSIIDDILDLTKVESGKMEIIIEKMSVPNAINTVVDVIKEKAASRNIIIKKQISHDIEFIETDPNRFRQVLNNILDNAVKFSKPKGGTVTITAEKEGEMAKFKVSDTGIGIRDEDMGRIFLSFEQLETGISRKYEGTGLGLVISKKLVEVLGGRITVESKYGEGSTFTFYLPLVPEKAEL